MSDRIFLKDLLIIFPFFFYLWELGFWGLSEWLILANAAINIIALLVYEIIFYEGLYFMNLMTNLHNFSLNATIYLSETRLFAWESIIPKTVSISQFPIIKYAPSAYILTFGSTSLHLFSIQILIFYISEWFLYNRYY